MKRTHLNLLIDTAAFAGFTFLASTGMVLAYQLPPGSGGRHGAGTGHAASERAVQLLWGLSRHEWGNIHYWTALILMAVLAIHLLLHWNWIVGVIRGKPSTASPYRLALGFLGLTSLVVLSVLPFAASTTAIRRGDLEDSRPLAGDSEAEESSSSIRGSMTFEEIAAASNVSVQQLLAALKLPANANPDEQAGRLLRRHGLQMQDLRTALEGLRRSPTANAPDE